MPFLKPEPVRRLSLDDLKLTHLVDHELESGKPEQPDASDLSADDWVLANVRAALSLGFAGVILSGPPGTGKSWYAQQIAVALTGDWEAVRSVQFHPSYQYEDFVFGYQSNESGVFVPTAKEFVNACRAAALHPDRPYVMVIDEISRSDVVRVFGEALTYLEQDKRDRPFSTAMGEELVVPRNLIVLATMNPWDKGVDELDAALERRFAQIDLLPDPERLRQIVSAAGAQEPFVTRLITFFEALQAESFERVKLGHAYFLKCIDEPSATSVWSLRLKPTLRRACSLDPAMLGRIEQQWAQVVPEPAQPGLPVEEEQTGGVTSQ